MLPDFLIIGAPKAATTWLADCLREHPQVFLPELKELRYFCGTNHAKGLTWYGNQFSKASGDVARVGEASPSYLGSPQAPQRIHDLLPQSKLILSLRHPVEQAYSFYWHLTSRGELPPTTDFARFFAEQRPRAGYYGHHVGRYREYFAADQMLILIYEREIQDDPVRGVRRCQEFLGIDTTHVPAALAERRNSGRDITALHAAAQLARRGLNHLPAQLRHSAKRWGKSVLRALPSRRQYVPLGETLRRELFRDHCVADVKRLEDMAGVDLSAWYGG